MAVRIIKQPEERTYRHTCRRCGTGLEYTKDDIQTSTWRECGQTICADYIQCPACKNPTVIQEYCKE